MSNVLRRGNDRRRHADSPKAAAQRETKAGTTEDLLVASCRAGLIAAERPLVA